MDLVADNKKKIIIYPSRTAIIPTGIAIKQEKRSAVIDIIKDNCYLHSFAFYFSPKKSVTRAVSS